jgi:two-component system sensor histidine kinase TctE
MTLRWLRGIPGVLPGGRSLRRHLLMWLLLPQLVLWLAAAWVTYNLAARYANQAIDASLLTNTRALARQVKPMGNGLLIDFPRAAQAILEADPEDRYYYMVSAPPGAFVLGNNRLPSLPGDAAPRFDTPVFYDGTMADADHSVPVRVAAILLRYGETGTPQTMLVQVAKSRASREELARRILQDTALPLSVLVLAMSLIVWAGIRAGLAPLARMRALVQDRGPNDLAPIRLDDAPQEVHALARAVNTLLGAVQESVTAQRRFISDAAHQLRTPLAGLKSQTELALAETDAAALHARLQRVHDSATRSAHLVNQLLTLARAEPGAAIAPGQLSRVDLRRMAADLCAEAVPRARAAGIDLGFEADDGATVATQGHPLLLREALANVVDNALRYAGRGAEVTVRALRQGPTAHLEVTDSGPGVAPEDRERMFERFARGTTAGDGAGLGLAIVREIVERHHGSVALEAHTPRGLRVCIALPAVD